jgi:hypothetical protein
VLYDGSIMTRAPGPGDYHRLGSSSGLGSTWQPVFLATNAPALGQMTRLLNGNARFGFTSQSGRTFTVLMSTNLTLPVAQWTPLGNPVESPAGTYQFTDSTAANSPRRFYRVTSP